MLDNPEIKAILCVRGGYGAIQLIDKLKLDNFNKNPKWLVGFSDITLLHALLGTENIASIHGAMPVNYTPDRYEKGVKQLFETLQGKLPEYSLPTNTWNKPGIANAEIVGGNLAIVCSLLGTPLDIDTNGKILFLEEVGEYLYRFDRMMYQLKLAGKLDNIKGLIVGGMSDMNDSEPYFEEKLEELILRQLSNNIPVLFDFPAGHIVNNQPIILGKETTLVVDERGGSLMY
jgi:muramoyltetrapeptide carboxypeptidase